MGDDAASQSQARSGNQWFGEYFAHVRHGPLPVLLIALTVSTGIIDAVSILSLGRVFVANMTGNVVFIGFALGGAPGFSLQASLVALVCFLGGAAVGGMLVHRFRHNRAVLLRNAVGPELVLLVIGTIILAVARQPFGSLTTDLVIACAATALGLQNAAVRALAVPDFTTTVLTMALTGIAADLRTKDFRTAVRRVSAVAAMLAGAVVGTLLVLGPGPVTALTVGCVPIAVVLIVIAWVARGDAAWLRAA